MFSRLVDLIRRYPARFLITTVVAVGGGVFQGYATLLAADRQIEAANTAVRAAERRVDADLIVTGVRLKSDSESKRVYAVDFNVNNSGGLGVTIISALPFVESYYDNAPPKNLVESAAIQRYSGTAANIEPGKMGSFTVDAHLSKDFLDEGRNEEVRFNKSVMILPEYVVRLPGIQFPLQLKVTVYGADRKYREAISQLVSVRYVSGRQVEFRQPRQSSVFQVMSNEANVEIVPAYEPMTPPTPSQRR